MKVAIVGSKSLKVINFTCYLPPGTTEIVSGGAKGIDTCARWYAQAIELIYTEFLPKYFRHGIKAPIKRYIEIIKYSDYVLVFWDGKYNGTARIIDNCGIYGVPFRIIRRRPECNEWD